MSMSYQLITSPPACLPSTTPFPPGTPLEQRKGAPILDRREAVLGAATLSCASLRLLYEIASLHIQALHPFEPLSAWHTRPVHERIAFHAASHSAAQTQAVLPPGALVQKTVTVEMAGK